MPIVPDNMYRCFSCKKEETDESKIVLCAYCCKCEHLACKGVFGKAVEKLRSHNYFCSVQCSEIAQRCANSSAGMESILREEIRTVFTEVQKVYLAMNEMQQSNAKLESNLSSLLDEIKAVKVGYSSLKDDVQELQDGHDSMNETVSGLQLEIDRINRAALSRHAIIMGVPVTKDEVAEQLVVKIASAVGYQLPNDAIVESKRIVLKDSAGKSAPIKVIFSDERYKEELFLRKKNYGLLLSSAIDPTSSGSGGSRVIMRDELTSFGMKLLKETRAVQEQTNVKFVWPGRNGVILAKVHEGSKPEMIRNMQDVRKLHQAQSKRQLDESMMHSTVLDEPLSKRHQP